MTNRKGAGRGTGKGYKNLRGFPRDSSIHSDSSRGRKQPQKIPRTVNLVARYNKTKNKDILPNQGLETKRIILKQDNIQIGNLRDVEGVNKDILLDFEIKEIDLSTQAIYNGEGDLLHIGNTNKTRDLKKVSKYKTLSISGQIGRGNATINAGQIDDTLRKGLNDSDFTFKDPKAVKEILDMWGKYHLNDLNAGTEKQEKELERVGLTKADDYTEAVQHLTKKGLNPDRGYKYGTAWLVADLPVGVAETLNDAINRARR